MNTTGALIISLFTTFILHFFMKLHIGISITLCIILYIIFSKLGFGVKLSSSEHKKLQKYEEKEYLNKMPYKGNPITMTIPFFRRIYLLFVKHNINKSPQTEYFWNHIDKVVSFWTSIRDKHKRENPVLILNNEERQLLHECWTNNAVHEKLLNYFDMKEETYEWKSLPELINKIKYYDVHGALNWEITMYYIQSFIQKVGLQLMYGVINTDGTNKVPPDCYQPPRFYGKYYDNFESLNAKN
jgi:hypothetical protein